MSFKSRLLLLTCVWFVLASMVIVASYDWQKTTIEMRTKQSLHKQLAEHMRDDNPLMIGTDYNPVALKAIFHTLMLIGPDFEIYFLDSQGHITSHAAPEGTVMAESVNLAPIRRFLHDEPFPILGDDPRQPDKKKVFSVAAIKELGSTVGYLYVVIGSSRHSEIANAQLDRPYWLLAALILIAIVGFGFLVYWLVRCNLLLPIENITRRLQQQAEHDFHLVADYTNQVPELAPIAHQHHLMAKRIQQQFLQLQHQGESQHNMLLQLSHDLKTPLSSVMGYLETWRLQSRQGDPLIDVAYRNSIKLSEQLQSLLDMAKSRNVVQEYCCESVDLAVILKECQTSVRTLLEQKNIRLRTEVLSPLPTMGDAKLLERLFDNLLENALRHSPPGQEIVLRAHSNPITHRIEFEIANPIAPQAPGGDLGMGLKIIKSILMLHHSQLNTESSEHRYVQRFELDAG